MNDARTWRQTYANTTLSHYSDQLSTADLKNETFVMSTCCHSTLCNLVTTNIWYHVISVVVRSGGKFFNLNVWTNKYFKNFNTPSKFRKTINRRGFLWKISKTLFKFGLYQHFQFIVKNRNVCKILIELKKITYDPVDKPQCRRLRQSTIPNRVSSLVF
jgi:hypothetical protein